MNNKNTWQDVSSTMVRELAIFEYVAGQQSADTKANFEAMLDKDIELSNLVKKEIALRSNLIKVNNRAPVEMENFDRLLEKIEQSDLDLSRIENDRKTHTGIIRKVLTVSQRHLRMAASVAVVCLISVGFLYNITSPDYHTLSNTARSDVIDFERLLVEQRVARIDFDDSLSDHQIKAILDQYNLKQLNAMQKTGSVLTVSEDRISASLLANLEANNVIRSATLVETSLDEK